MYSFTILEGDYLIYGELCKMIVM